MVGEWWSSKQFDTIYKIQYLMQMALDPANYQMKQNPITVIKPVQEVSFIPDMDDAQLRKLAREKLSRALQGISPEDQPEMTRKLCAELMDRLDGKPGQAITMDAKISVVTVNANVNFIPSAVDKIINASVDNMQVIDNE